MARKNETDKILDSARTKKDVRSKQKSINQLTERIFTLEQEIEAMEGLKGSLTHYKIEPTKDVKSEAVAVMVASDWHIEEMVYEWQVSGLNEFNADICRKRVARFFRHGLKLIQKERKATKINTLILALLGDFVSGSIHDELMEGNRLLPAFAIIEAQEHIASGIKMLLERTNLKIVIPCVSGN